MGSRDQGSLARALKQNKPFLDPTQEAYLAIVRTSADLSHSFDLFLRKYKITQQQYNVLRILRGAGSKGLGRNEIRDRMVNTMPDVTRLLDRMEKFGWLTRLRSDIDRRHVANQITQTGLDLLREIDVPIQQLNLMQFRNLDERDLSALLATLEVVRQNVS